ncbi:N-acetyltransferase GNAT family [Penicillium chrysogenum]|uniref:N-acetyltransferase GNAT family n=1 Tax=Penicillium chrysogenum TaxID=5076 RepID=A0ABQ8WZH7_PENCH|nr:N-acetyltransferase GNAT family [Penicillium chrysogenum]
MLCRYKKISTYESIGVRDWVSATIKPSHFLYNLLQDTENKRYLHHEPTLTTRLRDRHSIESDRHLLRPITDADAGALFAIRSRPEVAEMKLRSTPINACRSHHANYTSHPKTPFKSIEGTHA